MKIKAIHARQILDSRGNPTVEADVILDDGSLGRAAVPSGASTGAHEALELRDKDPRHYGGLGVTKAVHEIEAEIAGALVGQDAEQIAIDELLVRLDGTPDKSRLGANAILAVSLALAHARAVSAKKSLYQLLATPEQPPVMPVPLMNIMNGGKHAAGSTDIQEFMILPVGATSFSQALEMGDAVFHTLAKLLEKAGYATTVGDEGGYAPHLAHGNTEALDLIVESITQAGYQAGIDIVLGIDVAASELYHDGSYILPIDDATYTSSELIGWYQQLVARYPIVSIEDGLAEDDWASWQHLTAALGNQLQLVGDDLFVTNTARLKRGIAEHSANAILIKPNQIGTLTETIAAVRAAQAAGLATIMSHRSGETEDVTIAHLAVGLATGQIKAGSLSRSERIAKYNELLRIEEQLGSQATYLGAKVLPS